MNCAAACNALNHRFNTQLSQSAARLDAEYIQIIKAEYRAHRDYAIERINQIEGISCHCLNAGMFLMQDVSGFPGMDQANVLVLPGVGFGDLTKVHVRLSLTYDIDVLEEAFNRIEQFAASHLR